MAARQMAINESPDKLEFNGPCDEVRLPSTNLFKTFQSDVNIETIETFDNDLQWRKSSRGNENEVTKAPIAERNVIVHKDCSKEKGPTLASFLDNIPLSHLINIF